MYTGILIRTISILGLPQPIIAAALSFCVGIWSLLFGLLNLGFLFDLLPLPLVLGFATGLGQILLVSQIPPILGLNGISPVFIQQMPQIIAQIGQSKISTVGIAAVSMIILAGFQFVGKKWGHRSEIIRILAIQRSLLVIILMTTVSFLVNKNRPQALWSVLGPISTKIPSPQSPNITLVQFIFIPSFLLWIAINMEHIVIAKCYGRLNGYSINQNQEIVSLGVINTINSLFGGIPVGGGDLARTTLNSASGARSPLGGLFTSLTVFIGMFAASGFLQWLPQATVASVILIALVDQMPSISYMKKYWKLSFADFVVFFMTFNVTMLSSPEIAFGVGLGTIVIYTLFRLMFSRPNALVSIDLENRYSDRPPVWWSKEDRIPAGTQVVTLETDVNFLNAERIKRHVINTVYTYQSGVSLTPQGNVERAWNNRRDKLIRSLRRGAGISSADTFTPRFQVLVLDLTSTSFVDATGMQALEDIKHELKAYGGPHAEIRFVGMNQRVRKRFDRACWELTSPNDDIETRADYEAGDVKDLTFEFLPHAIHYQPQGGGGLSYVSEYTASKR